LSSLRPGPWRGVSGEEEGSIKLSEEVKITIKLVLLFLVMLWLK